MAESTNLVFTSNVVLRHPEDQEVHTFLIGDAVPEWANVGDHVVSTSKTGEGRVRSDDETRTADASNEAPEAPSDAEEDLPPYEEWSKVDLQNEVKGRGLEGYRSDLNKAELVELLEADDSEE